MTLARARRLLRRSLLALAAALAVAVPSSGAADAPYLNVWVHYDYMVRADGSFAPSAAAMQMVVDAFKAHGVTLHIDPQHTAIPERKVIVPDWQSDYAATRGFDDPSCTGPDAVRFSELKARYFRPTSNRPWHYVVFANDVFTDSDLHSGNCPATVETGGTPPVFGMTGDSQVGFLDVPGGLGYDFVVTFGPYHAAGVAVPDRTMAGVFMHELGHNLGLQHGGAPARPNDSQDNYKPNYLSVMNYDFTNTGIPYAAKPGSTAIAGYRVDYSDAQLPDLDERSLDETVGVQDSVHPTDITYSCADAFCSTPIPVSGPVDWNGNGTPSETNVQSDLDSNGALDVDHGFDDWAWIHSRLTPPAITDVAVGQVMVNGVLVGGVKVSGANLMGPATVIFTGGAEAAGFDYAHFGSSTDTFFWVTVPVGAQNGPVTIVTREGKVQSSESLTITSPTHRPEAMVTGPDGNVWFADQTANGIGRITLAGKVTEFPVPIPAPADASDPYGIAPGPDGNLWFTEHDGNAIGRIGPDGKRAAVFPIPTVDSEPSGITAGPDGNLWFTETHADQIGRITPDGQITEFRLPTASAEPAGITAGADGNLWFTEPGTRTAPIDQVGRISPAGAITEFPTYTSSEPSVPPYGITAGPDGNVWFTFTAMQIFVFDPLLGGGLGEITPSGTVSRRLCSPDSPLAPSTDPFSITGGTSSDIWFLIGSDIRSYQSVERGDCIGWGAYAAGFQSPTPQAGITTTRDGTVWFAENNSIYRLVSSHPWDSVTPVPLP